MTIVELFQSGLANYRTTILGALAGTINYALQVGMQMPTNAHDAGVIALSLAYVFLGLLAKDTTTGSQPANAVAPPAAPSQQGAAVDKNLNILPPGVTK